MNYKKPAVICPECGNIRHSGRRNERATLCRKCYNQNRRNPNLRLKNKGYVYVPVPNIARRKYIFEHRLIMEKHLGRKLKRKEVVHHINGLADDNRIENLFLCKNNSEHQKQFHQDNCGRFNHTAESKRKLSERMTQDLDFVTKEWLIQEIKIKTIETISKEICKSYGWVRNRLIRFDIPLPHKKPQLSRDSLGRFVKGGN